jgi:uncharacterized protein YegL
MALKSFTVAEARPLPVILALDVSGSMSGDKINSLNVAVREVIKSFAEEEDVRAEIHVAVVTFGAAGHNAELHLPLTPARKIETINDMQAVGMTPMGAAFTLIREMVEDKNIISSRAYTPTLVLVSDGAPNDEWTTPLQSLLNSDRAKKAVRLAMGIGGGADISMLEKFVDNPEIPVFEASQAREIRNFFKWVTMSVTTRSRSVNPNQTPIPKIQMNLDDLG